MRVTWTRSTLTACSTQPTKDPYYSNGGPLGRGMTGPDHRVEKIEFKGIYNAVLAFFWLVIHRGVIDADTQHQRHGPRWR